MIKDNLKLLDLDENNREQITNSLINYIGACSELGLILDCATSDNVLYVENEQGDSICIG